MIRPDLRIRQLMRVLSVPLSVPFLRTVIAALVDGALVEGFEARREPERLAQATLYLPTRRAGRLAREIFLDVLDVDAAILPRIVALGDIDEDELAFAEESDIGGVAPLDIPPKLGELERRLALARLVAGWAKSPDVSSLVVGGPASTLALAGDLARLIDDVVTRGVIGAPSTSSCLNSSTITGSRRSTSSRSPANSGRLISPRPTASNLPRAATS
jgi:ATP-dependent helicase/nuclease subunit B